MVNSLTVNIFSLSTNKNIANFRFGFPVPPNYDDNGVNCGGYGKQWNKVLISAVSNNNINGQEKNYLGNLKAR